MTKFIWTALLITPLAFIGCGGDDEPAPEDENEADDLGIGAQCEVDDDCPEVDFAGMGGAGGKIQLECLTQFTDGYCAIEGCDSAEDCPEGATCVAHEDGKNYCFRECVDKPECNANRDVESEANCVGSFDLADPADDDGQKVCEPSSSGI